jgi:hypothetical protein
MLRRQSYKSYATHDIRLESWPVHQMSGERFALLAYSSHPPALAHWNRKVNTSHQCLVPPSAMVLGLGRTCVCFAGSVLPVQVGNDCCSKETPRISSIVAYTNHQWLGKSMKGFGMIEWHASYRHARYDAVHPKILIYEVSWSGNHITSSSECPSSFLLTVRSWTSIVHGDLLLKNEELVPKQIVQSIKIPSFLKQYQHRSQRLLPPHIHHHIHSL